MNKQTVAVSTLPNQSPKSLRRASAEDKAERVWKIEIPTIMHFFTKEIQTKADVITKLKTLTWKDQHTGRAPTSKSWRNEDYVLDKEGTQVYVMCKHPGWGEPIQAMLDLADRSVSVV